ncbi:WGR domain-containing protein [Rhizobium sp. UGM030330-04]|uniref:WGR domain-containing protein n=1 Tax=Rhizobium sp. UGM030330-04 TaxID=1378077 RepID=UPI000BE3662E
MLEDFYQRWFYNLGIPPDLFGSWLLIREYGRVGSPGRLLTNWFETQDACQALLTKRLLSKQKKGHKKTGVLETPLRAFRRDA